MKSLGPQKSLDFQFQPLQDSEQKAFLWPVRIDPEEEVLGIRTDIALPCLNQQSLGYKVPLRRESRSPGTHRHRGVLAYTQNFRKAFGTFSQHAEQRFL